MLLKFEDGRPFAQGAATYRYRPATQRETTDRIHVVVRIEHIIETQAVLDTGAVYFVCDPEIADLLDLDPASGWEVDRPLLIRGYRVSGTLHRLYLTLSAEEGESLTLEVPAFVPHLQPNELWDLPYFMGLFGCLECIRFAVDPATKTFYFGAIDEGS
jgi:hypothetical protein